MPAYEGDEFTPPAPIARVRLRNPVSGNVAMDVPMLLDSGADVTLLPQPVIERLGIVIPETKGYELAGFDGSKSIARSVKADLHLPPWTFKGQFLVIDQTSGVIGRDILNNLVLVLDGPHLSWDIRQSNP